jgi:hypothetical protein
MRFSRGPWMQAWRILGTVCLSVSACGRSTPPDERPLTGQFASDVAFLKEHTQVVLLTGPSGGAQVVVAPAYQGRVMTSTTGGPDALSFGWIGRASVASGTNQPHMNVFGGEDRLWLGPEGGQYALYFKPGDPFDLDHWQVPPAFDWDKWEVASQSPTAVRLRKRMTLVNYARTPLDIEVDRTVRLLTGAEAAEKLGESPGSTIRMVAFESSNTITNAGTAAWQPQSGLVSVWILGQFNPSPNTTIALPYVPGPDSTLGPKVNDAYFGKVPPDRLVAKDSAILFRADGQFRSKIGLSPSRALSMAGSYDAASHVLTLVQFTRPVNVVDYVNSMWEIQREPYKGDTLNSYNDGPPAPGQPPLGPFYELETSSPALSLSPGQEYTHAHRTFHLMGPDAELDRIARATLKVSLAELTNAFPHASKTSPN